MILLQTPVITDTVASAADTVAQAAEQAAETAPAATAAAATNPETMSLWQLCCDGGWIMIVLAALLLLTLYVFFERSVTLSRASREDRTFMKRIRDYIHQGDVDSARLLCRQTDSPYSRLIDKGITRIGRPMNDVLVSIENAGNLEVASLSKGLPWLATAAAGAPMIGFLGTVIGMVQAFYDISAAGNAASIADFSGGIYTALVTTVAGLVVGIIALFAYNYLVSRVNSIMNVMEARTMEFMDLLNEPAGE